MKKIIQKLKDSDMLTVVVACVVFIVIAIIAFLGRGGSTVSGWQILFNQTAGEWLRMFFFSGVAGIVVWAYIQFYKKTQDSKGFVPFAVAFFIFLAIAFGKVATDKANDGVTSGNGRPGGPAQVEDNRVPAEDLLPK
jgi:amino acid transporter